MQIFFSNIFYRKVCSEVFFAKYFLVEELFVENILSNVFMSIFFFHSSNLVLTNIFVWIVCDRFFCQLFFLSNVIFLRNDKILFEVHTEKLFGRTYLIKNIQNKTIYLPKNIWKIYSIKTHLEIHWKRLFDIYDVLQKLHDKIMFDQRNSTKCIFSKNCWPVEAKHFIF